MTKQAIDGDLLDKGAAAKRLAISALPHCGHNARDDFSGRKRPAACLVLC